METLARMFVSVFDLVEAEGRLLRRQAIRTAISLLMFMGAGVFILVGVGFLLWGVHGYLSQAIGQSASALVIGAVWMLAAAALGLSAWWRSK